MKWERYIDDCGYTTKDWIAQGHTGHFLIYKEGEWGTGWRTLYMDDTTHEVLWRSGACTWWEAKQECQNNIYWET